MFCKYCGHKLPDGSKFCENCGAPVELVAEPSVADRGHTAEPAGTENQPDIKAAPVPDRDFSAYIEGSGSNSGKEKNSDKREKVLGIRHFINLILSFIPIISFISIFWSIWLIIKSKKQKAPLIMSVAALIISLFWFFAFVSAIRNPSTEAEPQTVIEETAAETKSPAVKETKKAAEKSQKTESIPEETVKETAETTREKQKKEEETKEEVQEAEINEQVPEGYAYILPEDLKKYCPNLSGVKIYTVGEVSRIERDCVYITLGNGFMMSPFYTDEDYTGTLKEDDTVAICGEVAEYTDYSFVGTSVTINNCKVFATNKYAEEYKKTASDETLSEYFVVNAAVADISSDISREDYIALCESADYESILRNPDEYKDKYIKVSGKVDQVIEGWFGIYSIFIVDKSGNKWEVFYSYKEGESHILENDRVTAYGKCSGTATAKTVLGKQVVMPSINGEYFD